ncbi:PspA/IM30 family protein [Halalkalibacterium halodurans]|uniref:PspA/IM30 family protein n=1 Tax=Halalkalibacterium halodurans TaxID=86665 RepID=UPI002AAA16A4|nr:PspA/IM30 family protein [Halalkalibacterium halodurans]MDY7222012.1 PspA/IM30 family protein [Halalkalibacterium halodurans]MDY7241288.1 PspA/IM30 family protein [Halalkalibacterium halodurans]
MSILARFQDIISSNINAVLDRMENPEKMIDQLLRNMMKDLAEVKQNTASVIAEETRAKRLVDENDAEVLKYTELAKKALQAGNDNDARVFLAKKQELEDLGVGLANTYATAHENASKMRQMHDKIASDIEKLKARRDLLKAQLSVANTQEKMNNMTKSSGKSRNAMDSFNRMEEKISRRLDEVNAMATLNEEPVDEAKRLEEKYAADQGSAAVEDELQRMKEEMGL